MVAIRFAPTASGKIHLGNLRIVLANLLVCDLFNLPKEILLRVDFQKDVSCEQEQEMINSVFRIFDIFNIDLQIIIYKQRDNFNKYYHFMDLFIQKQYAYTVNDIVYLDIQKFYKEKGCIIVRFDDMLIGKMYKKVSHIKNPIIYSKTKDLFFYNFMSVIDDFSHNIQFIIRGNDHTDNTYLQIIMFEMLNFISEKNQNIVPRFLHIPMCVTKFGKISKSADYDFSVESFISKMIFPDVIKEYLLDINKNIKSIGKAQKVINEEEILKLNRKYLIKQNNQKIKETISKLWNIDISIEIINKFKFFINNVQDMSGINNNISLFKQNKIKISKAQKIKIQELKEKNHKLELYSFVGDIFGYDYLGKEIIEYCEI